MTTSPQNSGPQINPQKLPSESTSDIPVENFVSSSDQHGMTNSNNTLAIIGIVTSQVTLITGLLYFAGWVYADRYLEYFGIDSSLVGYSTTDYVIRSLHSIFPSFIYLSFIAFMLLKIHHHIMVPALMQVLRDSPSLSNTVNDDVSKQSVSYTRVSRIANSVTSLARVLTEWRLGFSRTRWIIKRLEAIALLFFVASVIIMLLPDQIAYQLRFIPPIFILLTVCFLGYIEYLRSRYTKAFIALKISRYISSSRIYISVLLTFGLLAGLWIEAYYANYVGNLQATRIVADLPDNPEIRVYSTQRIAMYDHGIMVAEIKNPNTKYHYQYAGLRLLVQSAGKFLLLSSEWRRGDPVFFLRDDNSVQIVTIARR